MLSDSVLIYDARGNGKGKISPTITGDHQNRITDYTVVVVFKHAGGNMGTYQSITGSLCASGYSKLGLQEVTNDMYVVDESKKVDTFAMQAIGDYIESEQASCCKARDYKDATDLVSEKKPQYVVRRLTPKECCRLQGFPDWWDADVEGTDSNRYKMWGNGIALNCAFDILRRIAEEVKS